MNIVIKQEFSEYYLNLKTNFPNLMELDEDLMTEFKENLNKDKKHDNTIRYLSTVLAANLTLYMLPILIYGITKYLDHITNLLIGINNWLELFNKEFVSGTLILGVCGSISYLFIFPLLGSIKSKFKLDHLVFGIGINMKSKEYIVISIILSYISLGVVLFLLYFNFSFDQYIIPIVKIYTAIPLYIISTFLLMLGIISFIIYPITTLLKKRERNQPTCEIAIRLLSLLKSTLTINNIHTLENKKKLNILNRINNIASLIETYPKGFYNIDMTNNFYKSSYLFLSMKNSFIMPKSDSLEYCQGIIIKYCNCFLSGDIDSLPNDENAEPKIVQKQKSKISSLISIIVYLLIPILIYFSINHFLEIQLSEFEQSVLKLSYLIWSIIGISTNHSFFNTETKEFTKDIIKLVLRK